MNRVFKPLGENHLLVVDRHVCPICQKEFCAGQRTTLLSATAEIASTLRAVPVHASCGLRGLRTERGKIERIKEGDGSPFPVVTTDGKQWTLGEVGLE